MDRHHPTRRTLSHRFTTRAGHHTARPGHRPGRHRRTPDSITLSWTNPTDADLAAVIVRRAKGATAPAAPTDGTGITLATRRPPESPTPAWTPTPAYSYAVFTRDTTGNTSTPATLTTATTSEPQGLLGLQLPDSRDSRTRRSETKLVELLDQVPSGAQVSASFFIIYPDYPVVDALIDAHARGATVRVVLDSGYRQSAATNQADGRHLRRSWSMTGR